MPIHEYACSLCENIWEETQLSVDDIPLVCPECGNEKITKLISWRGMYTGEHRKAMERPAPSNPVSVVVPSNIAGKKDE